MIRADKIAAASFALAVMTLATSASARPPNDARPAHGVTPDLAGVPGVNSANAISILVEPGGSLLRAKGILSVSHPSVGQYCIAVRGTVKADTMVPVVAVDWSTSSGSSLLAYLRSTGNGCATNQISVLTYSFVSGSTVLSDTVGFTVTAN